MPEIAIGSSAGYLVAGLSFFLMGLLTLIGASGLLRGHRLSLAATGMLWAAYHGLSNLPLATALRQPVNFAVEALFLLVWFALLYRLLRGPYKQSMPETVRRALLLFWLLLVASGILVAWLSNRVLFPAGVFYDLILLSAALVCLALSAQLHRDAPVEDHGALQLFTWAGALTGGSQAVIFALAALSTEVGNQYSVFRTVPISLASLLLIAAARRRPQWSLAIFVSPQARAYAPRLLGMLAILALLAVTVPAFRALPSAASANLALGFVPILGLPVAALLFSEDISARLRVFISKHFLPFRYDYREEWLRLIDTLASPVHRLPLPERAIKAVAQIVGSPAGVLWLRRTDDEAFICAARWNTRAWPDQPVAPDDPVLEFMRERQWIMDTAELNRDPELYAGLQRPEWLERFPDALLVVPLISSEMLIGFIVLFQSSSAFRLTFEEIDLLRTSGRQIAAYLAQYQADQQLAEVQQFEAFNRLTAFVMHDLKNLIAQQSLVVKNASRHKDNPAFFEDAIATIDNSVGRMSRLLKQLQSGESAGPRQQARLANMLRESVERSAGRKPEPVLELPETALVATLERERFVAIVAHLIRNAQDATAADGTVTVVLRQVGDAAEVEIADDGSGMEAEFVRSRLFRPFDSTKGSKGMGIGAYQARAFVVEAGGSLDVWSEPGRGSRFTIRIPARVADDTAALKTAEQLRSS